MRPVRQARLAAFTLVEVAVAIGVLSVVLLAGTSVVTEAVQVSRGFDGSNAALADVRMAVDRMGRQWRAIEVQRLSGGNEYVVTAATSSSVTFSRRNADGTFTSVAIVYSSPIVTMQEGSDSAVTLLTGVSSFSLGYFDGVAGAAVTGSCCAQAWRRQVRAIRINMTVSSVSGAASSFTHWIAVRSS